MMKTICFILVFLLLTNFTFANPLPAETSNNNAQYIVLGVLTLGIGLFLYHLLFPPKEVVFSKETVNIAIQPDDSIQVHGKYTFRRHKHTANNFNIIYPFPDHKKYGDVIIQEIIVNGKEVEPLEKYLKNPKRISLDLFFEGSDALDFEICFTQSPPQKMYKYILRTTRKWNKPLEKAIINLKLPAGLNLINCNYDLIDLELEEGKGRGYKLYKTDFYPNDDLEFRWE